MAEIFGAVASGAGLVSLSMQLLESTQKLKGFYDACRDAPETVRQLCFDLETMALALEQFERYRQNDIFGSELLQRCILACDQAVARIKTAIDKVDRLLSRARFAGRVYMGFKEPEVRRLLEEMEYAKSSILLAHSSYFQSWNMRQAVMRANEHVLQSEHMKLLQGKIESGNAALAGQIAAFASEQSTRHNDSRQTLGKTTGPFVTRTRPGKTRRYRVVLPRWFTKCVWDFTIHEFNHIWTVQLQPVNLRPDYTHEFDFVRNGDLPAVRRLLDLGRLSVNDRAVSWESSTSVSLLDLAAKSGSLDLARFLLQNSPSLYDALQLFAAHQTFVSKAYDYTGHGKRRPNFLLGDAIHSLFFGEYGLSFNLNGKLSQDPRFGCLSPLFHTKKTFNLIMANRDVPVEDLAPAQRFSELVESRHLPAHIFTTLLYGQSLANAATQTNSSGKTALHWASEHFGARPDDIYSEMWPETESYKKLASQLIAAGADPHALWRQPGFITSSTLSWYSGISTKDPFRCFLTAGFGVISYTRSDLADAVGQWGDMLTDSGYSLTKYVNAENQLLLLQSLPCTIHILCRWLFEIVKLVLSKDSKLAIEIVEIVANVPTFKAQPITLPGAWPSIWPTYLPNTLIWRPRQEDLRDNFKWVEDREVRIRSQQYRVEPSDQPCGANMSRFRDMFFEIHESLARESRDDHTIEASARIRRPRAHKKQDHRLRPRAGSVPTLITNSVDGSRRHLGRDSTQGEAWLTYKDTYCAHSPLRGFMQDGHDYNLPKPGEYGWETWLVNSADHHVVARRFAERFFPHLVCTVDRVLEEATYRARIAMGPQRPEDMDM